MSTELLNERPEPAPSDGEWRQPAELAPSPVRPEEPQGPRIAGMVSFSALVLGGFILLMHSLDRPTLFGPVWGEIVAALFLASGVLGLLYHAVRDDDLQVRRVYMGVGFLLLAAGVVVSLVLYPKVGALFLPYGLLAFGLGWLFQLAYVRHETEEPFALATRLVLGGLGAVMALWGFVSGNIWFDVLLPQGLVLVLLGLLYLATFVVLEGVDSDLGYLVGLGIGALGALVCVVAVGRATLMALEWVSGDPAYRFMPGGMILITCGLLYLATSACLCSDNVVVVLTKREFVRFFYSPIAYFLLFGFAGIGWVLFVQFLLETLWRSGQPMPVPEPAVAGYIVDWFPIICVIVVVPILTMSLLSEEHRTGTLEVLLTSPVNEPAIVVSKLLGAWAFYLLIWLPWGAYLIALRWGGGQPFDFRPLLGFFVALAFTGLHFLSMGVFFSSLTRNQIISAALTFAGMLALFLAFMVKRSLEPGTALEVILTHVGFIDLWISSLQGKVPPRDLLFHLSAAIFWTFITTKILESRKWR